MGKLASQLSERAERFVIRRAPYVLLATFCIVILSLAQVVDLRTGQPILKMDPSVDGILPADDAGRRYYDEFKQLFSSGEVILLALVADDIFTTRNLERLQTISEEIEGLDQVDSVKSLSLSLNIRSEDGALVTEPFFDIVPESPAELADLRARALSDPIYSGNLISRDGRVAVVLIRLLDIPEREILESGFDDRIQEIAAAGWPDGEFWLSGAVHVNAEMTRVMISDMTVLVPIAALVMSIIAFISFRSIRGVVVPIAAVLISALASMAYVSVAYGTLNQLTAAIPSIMIVVGFAYSVHIVAAYYDAIRESGGATGDDSSPALVALRKVATPVLFTGFTTAAGFGSLATSSLRSIQEYGTATAIGVIFTMFITLTFSPALLHLLPHPKSVKRNSNQKNKIDRFDQSLARLARFDIRNRTGILIAGGVVAAVSLLGLFRVVVGTDMISSLHPDNQVRLDFDSVNRALEGGNSFNVVLSTSVVEGFKHPENLRALDDLQGWLASQPDVGGSTSFADYIKAIHQGVEGGDSDYFVIPDSKELVSQLLIIGGDDEIDQYVDHDFVSANIVVRTTAMDSIEVLDLVDRITARFAELPHHIEAQVTGTSVLVSRAMDEIAIGQAQSLALAFVIIYLILVVLFTSFRTGFIALIPNALPVLVFFGILGWSGVRLNASTGLVACIILGIAVDDTIHLLANFNEAAKRYADENRGIIEAMRNVGKPVTYTTAALCLGFGCMAFSEMQPQVEFGYLAAVTLLAAWVVDLTFTPALASRMQIVTIWDVLTLDLGDDPQRSIPLFAKLSTTQARIAALMARIVEFKEGHQIMKNGDDGREMYVVIDGELKATLYSEDGEILLRTHSRGDIIGEVALFHGRRTADVTAKTDVRLMEITMADFENIQRRHPRIGAQLYANLNKVLANRMAELTSRTHQRLAVPPTLQV